jgi:hypothetical protein
LATRLPVVNDTRESAADERERRFFVGLFECD